MDPDLVETVTVDSYTTLVDVGSQATVLAAHGVEDAEAVSDAWRSQYILYSTIAGEIDAYRPFEELIGMGLSYALEAHGYDLPPEERAEIQRTVYEAELSVFPDVADGIGRLVDGGYDVYVLSNGSPEMLSHLLAAAGIEDVVEDAVSADEVRTYKPGRELYRHAAARTGTPIGRILHASGGGMRDVWGAKAAGMRTAWLARPSVGAPRETLGPEPDVVVEDFHDLADRLV